MKGEDLPKISIVIPSYNKADYIEETLKSIISQDYPNLEVIIQDGGSDDGTLEIIKKYAKKCPAIIEWESKKDKGQTDAINKGLKKATGDILTYINADDIYEKGALRIVGEYFARKPKTLWLAGKGKIVDENGEEMAKAVIWYKNFLLFINKFKLLLVTNYLIQPSVFLSRQTYQNYGPFVGERYVMEYDLWLKIARVNMPERLNIYLSRFRLTTGGFSMVAFRQILNKDYRIAAKYSSSPLTLLMHKINNIGRILMAYLLKK